MLYQLRTYILRSALLLLSLLPMLPLQAQTLSPDASITLLTCTPGLPLYYHYGHSAIRVQDPMFLSPDSNYMPIDWTFNYGVFDFNQPGFYTKFVEGKTDYLLWIEATQDFLYESALAGRTVYYQTLRLTPEEKQDIFTALMINFRPENRFYRYNFVYDNCATRPWHIIRKALQLPEEDQLIGQTWRQQIDYFSGRWTWGKFGINLCFGYGADREITREQSLFLPNNLMQLVSEKEMAEDENIGPCEARNGTFFTSPEFLEIILVITLLLLTGFEYYKKFRLWGVDVALFLAWGLFGCIITYLYFFSSHPFVDTNLNVLWFNPIWLLLAILLCIPVTRRYLLQSPIFSWMLVWLLIALCALLAYRQTLHPLLVLIALQTWRMAFLNKKMNK